MKPVSLAATVLLATVSLAHLLRILFGVRVTVMDEVIPMWVSWVAFLVAGGVALMLWRSARRTACRCGAATGGTHGSSGTVPPR